jgi:hypothetical protein
MTEFSLSEVAQGKVMVAAKEGRAIPLGWALDADRRPTTDAQAALEGSMLPIGAVGSIKGRDAGSDRRVVGHSPDRIAVWLRCLVVLCRLGQRATYRPSLFGDRPGRAGRA